jgi:hypothetical protein
MAMERQSVKKRPIQTSGGREQEYNRFIFESIMIHAHDGEEESSSSSR